MKPMKEQQWTDMEWVTKEIAGEKKVVEAGLETGNMDHCTDSQDGTEGKEGSNPTSHRDSSSGITCHQGKEFPGDFLNPRI